MLIHGKGSDIVDVIRIKKALKKKNFKKRIFSSSEIKYIENNTNKIPSYAKKFAAKEAFSKALGTGISGGISFNEISINNDKNGKPEVALLGNTNKVVKKIIKKNYKIFLTITDEQRYAFATVIITF